MQRETDRFKVTLKKKTPGIKCRSAYFKSRQLLLYGLRDCVFLFVCVAVNGGWSEWARYGSCRVNPCLSRPGYRFRERDCDKPAPRYGGDPCDGIRVERELCYNTARCPTEGETFFSTDAKAM